MNSYIDIQMACSLPVPVDESLLTRWADATLEHLNQPSELTIRLVDEEEMTELNSQYRNQNKSTNVLAFPSSLPDYVSMEIPLIGDVIICPSVLDREAREFKKPLKNHWAHIVVHGILHLLGYDHIKEQDEKVMQALEVDILNEFGIDNPYYVNEE